ncbi:MAG: ACT domain-containing protein [Lachnospiraceae bacterium]|nr:ACT domain-containing protein [Lachnospiraceae bacterium]
MKKIVITVVGKDQVGIIGKVCTFLADRSINILDITQTIVAGYFNMMMIVEAEQTGDEFIKMVDDLKALGETIGVVIQAQNEDIFNMMHRI